MSTTPSDFSSIPVVVLCGGRSVSLGGAGAQPSNKALVPLRGQPMFSWVLRHYVRHGARQFIMATGLQSERFPAALVALGAQVDSQDANLYGLRLDGADCSVRLVHTGDADSTAARLLACKAHVQNQPCFALTYSDTLSDVDLNAVLRLHRAQQSVATLVAARAPVRFRVLGIRHGESLVRAFSPRPVIEASRINGGYYLLSPALWEVAYGLSPDVALENQPLDALAAAGQLAAYAHPGQWHYLDTDRDLAILDTLAAGLESGTT